MIQTFVSFLAKTATVLDRLSDRESVKAQAKLTRASSLVVAANGHRAAAKTGRKVAQALRDLTA